ncbi:hypothetical protein [Actomonas aquatica]|uniref:TonB-dependent receptor n=1 Tax=Actomonas aquatica TaxID=2866162 RepID=A0ABZ1C9P6_9BACT|nr:hypothetical protein [Opitutus sp. WL0086]WRQ88251.1 hypothetical protein K1X11_002460 [Opitutus sp. WL0086]
MKPYTPIPRTAPRRRLLRRDGLAAALAISVVSSALAQPAPIEASSASADEEIVNLSPFEVTADTNGYFQSNTMSGTRLNTKIEDLGQSITVMTKEQMADFAILDINDAFEYMASTEGTSSFSLFETDRTGAVVDQVSLDPNNANRVRGIGNANIAFNNIGMTGRVPVDPLWMDSLELSRGANANIFGLGNASGTVNQAPATANLSRDFNKLEVRADSYGGWRGSVDINRALTEQIAVRASYAKQHTGFIRKPSGEDAERLSLQLKFQPLKNTTISASWYNYQNTAVRPNFTTPRDYYTPWVEAGMPGWNAVTGLVTMANGDVYGRNNVLGSTTPYTATPSFLGGAENRSIFQIGGPGESPYWTMTRYTSGALADTDPIGATNTGVGLLTSRSNLPYNGNQVLVNSVVAPIGDKSLYDYTEINLAANSKAWDDVDTYMVQLDQIFLNDAKQTLAFQGTFMREDVKRLENQPMGPASVNSIVGQMQVDVNEVNLDGTPNPYFGRPFLRSSEPFLRDRTQLWDTSRAQAVYRLDFSQDDGWTKWIGSQQLVGYYEHKDRQDRHYAYRHSALNLDQPWQQKYAALNTPLGNRTQSNVDTIYPIAPGNYARTHEYYYVGDTVGGGIEYAPGYFPEGTTLPFVWGSSPTSIHQDVTAIGWTPSPDGGGGGANRQTIVKTMGGILQSAFLDGRLVTTLGLREDRVLDRNAPLAKLTADLRDYDFAASNQWNEGWRAAEGKTENISIVGRPFQDLRFLRDRMEHGSGIGRFLAEAVEGLSITYNTADNFIAQGPAYDLFLNELPNQTGTTKDLGFWLSLFDGKLSLRYVHYDTKQLDLRNGDISTMAQRILRMDGLVANDRQSLMKHAKGWLGYLDGETPPDDVMANALQMPLDQYVGLKGIVQDNTYAAVNDMESTGDELEINFNPTRNWTVSASITKMDSINTAAGAAVDEYFAARVPVWSTIEDPRFTRTTYTPVDILSTPEDESAGGPVQLQGDYSHLPVGPTGHLLYWGIVGQEFRTLVNYDNNQSPEDRYLANVNSPMAVFRALVGRSRPQVRKYSAKFNTKFNFNGVTDNRILKNMSVGGSVRWTDQGNIGFYGQGYDESLDLTLPANRILELDTYRPIYTPAETYVDLFASYTTKLFSDKVKAKFQLNVKNVFEDGGRLQVTSAYLDGRASTYRIIDPRQFIFSASFDL